MDCTNMRPRLESFGGRYIHYLQADRTPARCSFAEFARQAGELIDHLRSCDVVRGWRVGLLGPNCLDWLIWDLALIELGCTVVALPEELLSQHGAAVFEKYDLSFIVRSRNAAAASLADHPHACWMELRTAPTSCRRATGAVPFPIDEDVCALAFSSGSSGTPKCLMINRRGIEWDVTHYVPEYQLRPSDRLLVFLPLTLQQQRLLVYSAYWHGVSIALAPAEQLFEALAKLQPSLCLAPPLLYEGIHERFLGALDEMSARRRTAVRRLRSVVRLLPAWMAWPLRRVLFGRIYSALGGRMRMMLTGMAPIKRATLEFFDELALPLYEAYGLTETGVIASNTPSAKRTGSVGKPVKGCRITLQEDGEVLVHRQQLASFGYLDRGSGPVFSPGEAVATGDIGRVDADGFLYLLGRKKELIITAQGLKIHPERIESLLNGHPLIAQAVVLGDEQKCLVCLVSVRTSKTPEVEREIAAEVTRVNEQSEAGARIGKVVVTQERFTLTNGLLTRSLKLDRRAIAERFSVELFGRAAVQLEPTAAELGQVDPQLLSLVREIWQEVLGRARLPLKATFFDLGGDSLAAMRTLTRLQERLTTQITIRELYQDPTILGVARALTNERRALAEETEAVPIEMDEGVI